MTKPERIAERANALLVRAMDALDEASRLAEEVNDLFSVGRIDAARLIIESADTFVEARRGDEASGSAD